jgi:Outer membrane protein beta-barrel domain
MCLVHSKKIKLKKFLYCLSFTISCSLLSAQLNYYENGKKAFYWGISLGLNSSNFSIDRQPINQSNDTILSVDDRSLPGYNLGIIGNWQINKYFDLRFIPNMTFGEKIIDYRTTNSIVENKMNTTYISFPISVRYKSEPIKDWRIFVIAGMRYEYNIVPQLRTLDEPDRIVLKKNGLSMEYGIGIQYFLPYFIFSPELKYSHSIYNMYDSGQSDINNSAIKGLYPRALTLTINFEG